MEGEWGTGGQSAQRTKVKSKQKGDEREGELVEELGGEREWGTLKRNIRRRFGDAGKLLDFL